MLLSTRPEDKPPAGREFPGGKIEPGETLKQAAERELREELGVGVVALDELFRCTHETEPRRDPSPGSSRTVLPEGEAVTPLEGQSFGWFDLKEPMPPDLLAPDRPVWEFLAE